MIEILERRGDVLVARAFGGARRKRLMAKRDVDELLAHHGQIRMLLDLDLRVSRPQRLLEDVRVLAKGRKSSGRIAIVGNRVLGAIVRVALKGGSEVRVFTRAQEHRARAWIRQGLPTEKAAEARERLDAVDEASDESFPASDPPGYTGYSM